MGSLGNRAIARACRRCGAQCRTTDQADRHCRGTGHGGVKPKPATCLVCGKLYSSSRAAYTCCQQAGTQRTHYQWRLHESVQRGYDRRIAEIRGDDGEMEWIRIFAEYLLELMPPLQP